MNVHGLIMVHITGLGVFSVHLGVLLHVLATYESQRTLCKLRRAGDKSPGSCV